MMWKITFKRILNVIAYYQELTGPLTHHEEP